MTRYGSVGSEAADFPRSRAGRDDEPGITGTADEHRRDRARRLSQDALVRSRAGATPRPTSRGVAGRSPEAVPRARSRDGRRRGSAPSSNCDRRGTRRPPRPRRWLDERPTSRCPPGAATRRRGLERRLVDQLPPQRPHRSIGERRLRRDELADDTLGVGETSRAAQGVPRSRSASGSDLSLRSVCVSIWRMRSRVTPNARPTSSSVRGSSPSRP